MWDPTSIVFGIRHKKVFSFLDRAGEILDDVVEMAESGELPRGATFDEVGWQKTLARLQSRNGAVALDLSIDGIVLTIDPTRSGMRREAARQLILKLAERILPATGGGDRINRIGMLDNYQLSHEASGEAAIAALTNLSGLGAATDIGLRVSFRSPTETGLVSKDIGDWRNTIIQVWNRKNDETESNQNQLDVSIDYQTYFVPERQYKADPVEQHYQRFMERLDALQTGRLADLHREPVER